jgi:hypothetical protein
MGGPRGRFLAATAAIAGVALWVRVMGLDKGLWLDEYYALAVCCEGSGLSAIGRLLGDPSLYYPLLRIWRGVSGGEEFSRLLSVLFGTGAVIAVLGGVAQASRGAGVVAAALLASLPLALRYSQEIRPYGLLMWLTSLIAATLSRQDVLRHRVPRLVLSLALAAGIATHPTAASLVPAVFVFAYVAGRTGATDWRTWVRVLWLPSLALAAWLLWLGWRSHAHLADWWMPPPSADVLIGIANASVGRFRSAWPPDGMVLLVVAPLVAALIAAAWAGEPGPSREAPAWGAASLASLGALWLVSQAKPVMWPRTVLPALVLACCGLAHLVAGWRARLPRLAAACLIGAACTGWMTHWVKQGAATPVEPWGSAAEWLDRHWRAGDQVLAYPAYAALPLVRATRVPPASIAAIPAASAGDAIERATLATRGHPGPVRLLAIVRLDNTMRIHSRTARDLADVLLARSQAGQVVRILVLTSSDVEVAPGVLDAREILRTRLAAGQGGSLDQVRLGPSLDEIVLVSGAVSHSVLD